MELYGALEKAKNLARTDEGAKEILEDLVKTLEAQDGVAGMASEIYAIAIRTVLTKKEERS